MTARPGQKAMQAVRNTMASLHSITHPEAVTDPEAPVPDWPLSAVGMRRMRLAVERVMSLASAEGDIAVVSHGGVGALLRRHLRNVPINRDADQPGGGGGDVYSFCRADRQLLSGWRRIEE